jgi:hypothetical protein
VADIATQEQAFRLLKDGARLLYTSAAGQPIQLGDVNAWFEQYNQLVPTLELGDTFGAIIEQQNENDPLLDQATAAFDAIAQLVTVRRDEFAAAVDARHQGQLAP